MKNKFFTFLSLGLLFGHFATAQSYNGAESVEFDYANNRYLVSNTGSNQIIARAANGTLSVFATLTAAPYGIEIVGDTLYCCTGGTLRAVNLNTGSIIFSQLISSGAFLNGITHDPAGNLYITGFASSSKKIFRFNTATRQFNVFVDNTISQPNGIIYDAYDGVNPRLVLASWGSNAAIRAINLSDSTMTTLVTTPFGSIDGIAKGKNGNFYIACWSNNSIQRYDSTFANAPTAMVTSGITSPADIFYNQLSDTLAVPFGGNVNFYYFGVLTAQPKLLENNITIYPNPTKGIIHFDGMGINEKNINFSLYEASSGRIIFSESNIEMNNKSSIDLSKLNIAKGMYLAEFTSNTGFISRKKLIIE